MALTAKFPHIRIDQRIWDDPAIVALKPSAFRTYIFSIAWSKSQSGRVPDGILTEYGCGRIGASTKDLQDLVDAKLYSKKEDGSFEILKYTQWQVTSEEERGVSEINRENGKLGAAKRWQKPTEIPPLEDGFDVEASFEAAWGEWPDPSDPKMREKRTDAFDSFRANIVNPKDYDAFSSALTARIRDFKHDARPRAEKRQFLGAFKNFCNEKWRNWIPKSYRPPTTENLLQEGMAKLADDPVAQKAMKSTVDNTAPKVVKAPDASTWCPPDLLLD